jgi:hypothetical protein
MLNDLTKKKINILGLLLPKPSKEQKEARDALAKPEHDKLIESALRVL